MELRDELSRLWRRCRANHEPNCRIGHHLPNVRSIRYLELSSCCRKMAETCTGRTARCPGGREALGSAGRSSCNHNQLGRRRDRGRRAISVDNFVGRSKRSTLPTPRNALGRTVFTPRSSERASCPYSRSCQPCRGKQRPRPSSRGAHNPPAPPRFVRQPLTGGSVYPFSFRSNTPKRFAVSRTATKPNSTRDQPPSARKSRNVKPVPQAVIRQRHPITALLKVPVMLAMAARTPSSTAFRPGTADAGLRQSSTRSTGISTAPTTRRSGFGLALIYAAPWRWPAPSCMPAASKPRWGLRPWALKVVTSNVSPPKGR